jgi:hypothetical protein
LRNKREKAEMTTTATTETAFAIIYDNIVRNRFDLIEKYGTNLVWETAEAHAEYMVGLGIYDVEDFEFMAKWPIDPNIEVVETELEKLVA